MSVRNARTLGTLALSALLVGSLLVVGGVVTYLAFSAYRRTFDRSLGFLAVGFSLIVVGVLLAGVTFELLDVALGVGILLESLFVLAGLSIIAYSLRVR